MVQLRPRNASPGKRSASPAKEKAKKSALPQAASLFSLKNIASGFLISIAILISLAYTFTSSTKNIPSRVFTLEELSLYNGSDVKLPIYLSIMGKVYDVTAGRRHYGPEGGYPNFAGRDATRSFITGCFTTHLTHDLRGLTDDEIKGLDGWIDTYANSKTYFYVGTVELPEIDPDSPIPEPC